jgi:hypothetical protein
MENKLSFIDGMEKLRLQKRKNDPAWPLKELELGIRRSTLAINYNKKADALLESRNRAFKAGFQLALNYYEVMVKAGEDNLGNNPDITKFERNHRAFAGHLNELMALTNEDFNEGFLAGKQDRGSYMFELANLLEEYYSEEEIARLDNCEKPNPRVARIFSDVCDIQILESSEKEYLSDEQNSNKEGKNHD